VILKILHINVLLVMKLILIELVNVIKHNNNLHLVKYKLYNVNLVISLEQEEFVYNVHKDNLIH